MELPFLFLFVILVGCVSGMFFTLRHSGPRAALGFALLFAVLTLAMQAFISGGPSSQLMALFTAPSLAAYLFLGFALLFLVRLSQATQTPDSLRSLGAASLSALIGVSLLGSTTWSFSLGLSGIAIACLAVSAVLVLKRNSGPPA